MLSLLINIKQTLILLIRLYKLAIAQNQAEVFPGRSRAISRIRAVALEEKVDPDLAVRVARCESNFKNTAINIISSVSIDRGLFQWNSRWHPEVSNKCAFDIECSTRAFCQAVKDGHLNWWDCSKSCWQL